MLEIAGSAVLMANAPEDLKALARTRNWRIGQANINDGVAEAIETALAVTSNGGHRPVLQRVRIAALAASIPSPTRFTALSKKAGPASITNSSILNSGAKPCACSRFSVS